MIVYVETNFILELAFEQEQHEAANRILEFVEEGKIELAFPAFSIGESLSKVTRQEKDRSELYSSLIPKLEQLKRSAPYRQIVIDSDPVLALLQNAIKGELDRLLPVLERMLRVGRSIETSISSFTEALAYRRQLSIEDSIIYTAIISDLRSRPYEEIKRFLSRDNEAFGYNPRIEKELKSHNCKYVGKFEDVLHFIEHELRKAE